MTWHIDTEQTTTYLREMVQIESINPDLDPQGSGETAVAQALALTVEALGLTVELQQAAPNRPNLIARWAGSGGGKSLLLTGHLDTVSVEGMPGNPLDARIEDGKLYGRGSYDMKGGIAAILGAVAALKRGGFQPRGDLYLGFVADEEYLSIGMEALVRHLRPDAALLTEPTDLQLCIAHKGFAWVTLTTHGHATHGSRYDLGVDAIAHMGRLLNEMERLNVERFAAPVHPLIGRASVHASLIEGGLGLSTYPSECRLKIEHRTFPTQTGDDVIRLWNDIIARLSAADPQFRAEIKLDSFRPGYEIERDAPIVTALHRAFQQTVGTEPQYCGAMFWMDSAILGGAGIPTAVIGTGGAGAHAAVEYVPLADVHRLAAILAEATAAWCG